MATHTTTVTITSSQDTTTDVTIKAGTEAVPTALMPTDQQQKSLRIFAKDAPKHYGDFRDDLVRDGFALIKGAVPKERAEQYGEQMFKWLEDL